METALGTLEGFWGLGAEVARIIAQKLPICLLQKEPKKAILDGASYLGKNLSRVYCASNEDIEVEIFEHIAEHTKRFLGRDSTKRSSAYGLYIEISIEQRFSLACDEVVKSLCVVADRQSLENRSVNESVDEEHPTLILIFVKPIPYGSFDVVYPEIKPKVIRSTSHDN